MSFGSDLKEKFDFLTKGSRYIEVELFTKLQDALLLLQEKYGSYGIKLIHGDRSKVSFAVSSNYVIGTTGTDMTRELADMFFIVMSPRRKEIRCFFLQNKDGDRFLPEHVFSAELIQLDLLKHRSVFQYHNKACNILSAAQLPSIASYGVFYHSENYNYNMAYIPADKIEPIKSTGKGLVRCVKCDASWGTCRDVNGYRQLDGCETLTEFANGMINMTIGEPLRSLKTIRHICGQEVEKMCMSLLENNDKTVWVDSDEDYLRDLERFEVSGEIATKSIVIINADQLETQCE